MNVSESEEFPPVANPSEYTVPWQCKNGELSFGGFLIIPKELPSGFSWKVKDPDHPEWGEALYTSLGTESVTVPAGTFKAVKIEKKDLPPGSILASLTWYAAGVGEIKSYFETSDGTSSTAELISYSIPE
jgi:hypothetical protein